MSVTVEQLTTWLQEASLRPGSWADAAAWLLPRLGDARPEPAGYESAVSVEFPSGNWAGILDADLASVLVPLWNAQADENQILRAEPMKRQGLGPNQEECRPRIGAASRARAPGAPAPSEAALCAEMLERIVAADAVGPYLRMDIARAAKCLRGAASSDDRALREALLNVSVHSAHLPEAPRDLLVELLAKCGKIARAALAGAAPSAPAQ